METAPPFYVVIRATRRSRRLQCKEVPSFLSYFKTQSNGPAPGIEPATSRSAVKRSADWANPATVKLDYCLLYGGHPKWQYSTKHLDEKRTRRERLLGGENHWSQTWDY